MSLLRADAAERALLAGILVWPDKAADSWRELEREGLSPDCFGVVNHSKLAAAIARLVARGEPVGFVTVFDALSQPDRETAGAMMGTLHGDATAAHVRSHAAIVTRTAHKRRVHRWHLEQAEHVAQDDELLDPDAWRSHCEAMKAEAANLADAGRSSSETVSATDVLREVHRDLALAAAGIKLGSPSGFPMLDLKYKAQGGHLVVIPARPKMGKTTIALALTRHAVFEEKTPVLWACDEMRNSELMKRILSDVGDVSSRAIADPSPDWLKGHLDQIVDASQRISVTPLEFIEEADCGRVERIFAAARTWRAKHPRDPKTGKQGPAHLYLDYLQRMRISGRPKGENNEQRVAAICLAAKTLARELDITVFLLAQLNRDLTRREDKRPMASDIRDSGTVEQEADAILALFRPIVYEDKIKVEAIHERIAVLGSPRSALEREELEALRGRLTDAEIIVCANRHGPDGTVRVNFHGNRYRFSPRGTP